MSTETVSRCNKTDVENPSNENHTPQGWGSPLEIRQLLPHVEQTKLHSNNKLWVDIGEAKELCLVQIHDEQFVCRSQLGSFRCELAVKVADIFSAFL